MEHRARKHLEGPASKSLTGLHERETLDPRNKHVALPAATDHEPMDGDDEEEHADAAPAGKSGGTIVWELLQKGLKKAMGPTRDQLEFTIKIRSMFDGFDQSGDGQLAGQELRKALRDMGVHVSKREMKSLMMRFDQNHDGQIDHAEFEDMVKDLIPPPEFDIGGIFLEQKLKAMFEMMDTNGDKFLDVDEMLSGLQKLGLDMSHDHMERIISNADKSGDGVVDYDEFVQIYTKYRVHNYSDTELKAIEEKWELPEVVVKDCRALCAADHRSWQEQDRMTTFDDSRCKPGQMVCHKQEPCVYALKQEHFAKMGKLSGKWQ